VPGCGNKSSSRVLSQVLQTASTEPEINHPTERFKSYEVIIERRSFLSLAITAASAAACGQSLSTSSPSLIHPLLSGEDRLDEAHSLGITSIAFKARVLKRLHYPLDVMLTCVRWYVAYPLSLRPLEEMMSERGISVDHSTMHRWVMKLLPVLEKVFRLRKCSVGKSWHMDESKYQGKGTVEVSVSRCRTRTAAPLTFCFAPGATETLHNVISKDRWSSMACPRR
jgi:hypothetical protein